MLVEKLVNNRIAVQCITREQCYALLQLLDKQNLKWCTGEKATERVPFVIHKDGTCIAIWAGEIWSENVDWFKKHGYQIVECSEIDNLPKVSLFALI